MLAELEKGSTPVCSEGAVLAGYGRDCPGSFDLICEGSVLTVEGCSTCRNRMRDAACRALHRLELTTARAKS